MLGSEPHDHIDYPSIFLTNNPIELELDRKLFVSNLPSSTTVQELTRFFSVAGSVESASVELRDGRPAGYGFVTFAHSKSILKALDRLATVLFQHNLINMEPTSPNFLALSQKESKPNSLDSVSKKETESLAQNHNETPSRGRGRSNRGRGSRGTPRSTTTRLDEDSFRLLELVRKGPPPPIRGRRFPLPPTHFKPLGEPSDTTVYVGNLGLDIDETRLHELFAQWNPIKSWLIYRANTNNPKGFGFVELPDSTTQSLVLSQPPIQYQNRMLLLRAAVLPKSEESPVTTEHNNPNSPVPSKSVTSTVMASPPTKRIEGFLPTNPTSTT